MVAGSISPLAIGLVRVDVGGYRADMIDVVAVAPTAQFVATLAQFNNDDERYGSTMATAFVFAVVVTSPYAIRQLRRWLARRAARRDTSAIDTAATIDPDGLELVIQRLDEIAASDGNDNDTVNATVDVPSEPTYRGRPVDPTIARLVISDAARSAGLSSEWLDDHHVRVGRVPPG